ncbi:type 1 glutamine amidotransferase [Methyloligella solikamskensis]|uniref:Type 1 glutamine amidotransferase n=1 Tax=Methyloligella solikamskensis TaxID=1177756 RepID=A0ABW3J8W8_9HYPH
MKTLVLQNSELAGLGIFQEMMETTHALSVDTVDAQTVPFAEINSDQYDLVVTLGAPEGVYQKEHGWIAEQRDFVRKLLDEGKPLIGICFGGQIIASALGSDVRPMTRGLTRGWIENDVAVDETWKGPWYRWHKDMFDFPKGATVLAADTDIPQAFQYGNAVGLQFHPEVDEGIIESWVKSQSGDIESLDEEGALFLADSKAGVGHARERTEALLDNLLKRVLRGRG